MLDPQHTRQIACRRYAQIERHFDDRGRPVREMMTEIHGLSIEQSHTDGDRHRTQGRRTGLWGIFVSLVLYVVSRISQ